MQSLRQALNQFRQHWKDSVILGLVALLLTLVSHWIPLLGGWVLSLGLLLLEFAAWFWLQDGVWPSPKKFWAQIQVMPLLVSSLIVLPTSMLIGSASGLLQNIGEYGINLLLSLFLFFIGVGFFLILSHALGLTLLQKENLLKAFDKSTLAFVRNFRLYAMICFYVGAASMIAALCRGPLFVVVLPVLFYASFYSFKTVFATAPSLENTVKEI